MEPDQEKNTSEGCEQQSIDQESKQKDTPSKSLQDLSSQIDAIKPLDLRVEEVMDQKDIGKFEIGWNIVDKQRNTRIREHFKNAYNLFVGYFNNRNNDQLIQSNDNMYALQDMKAGLDLLDRLMTDKVNLQEDANGLRSELSQARKLISSLQKEYDKTSRKNVDLEQRIQEKDTRLRSREDQDSRKFQDLREGYSKSVDILQQRVHQSEQQVNELSEDRASLQKQLDDLEAAKSRLMSELARYQRDKSTTYEAGDRPQNYMLAQEYKTLQEQYLDRLAGSILSTFGDRLDILKEGDRKRKLNRVKSMLSRSILMVGQAIIKGEAGTLPKPGDEILNMVYVIISQRINFPSDSPYADAFKDEIEHLLSTGLSLASGKVQYPKPEEWQEKDFSLATQEIANEVYNNFEIRDIDKAIEQELQNTIKECLLFLQKTTLADPPGLLSIEKERAAFDSNRHEIAKGCLEESGQVLETIYPFYLDNGTVRTKAIVWLEPSSEIMISDSSPQDPASKSKDGQSDSQKLEEPTDELPKEEEKNDDLVKDLQDRLIKKLEEKKFTGQTTAYGVGEGAQSDEYDIRQDIISRIRLIKDHKTLNDLRDFLLENVETLDDFQNEINRFTSD